MPPQVLGTPLHSSGVNRPQAILLHATVHLQRANGSDDDRRFRLEPGEPAFDVQELLGAEVGAEARFRQYDVREGESELRRHDRVAAMGDVAKRAAVHERGATLQRLDEVRVDRVLEQQRHGALRDRKSTRLNSSHVRISYAVFCLKKITSSNPK